MQSRRRFLSALASLAAAAGLSRLAGGAAGAEPAKSAPAAPEGLTFTRTAAVTGLELDDGFTGVLRVLTNTSEYRNGKWHAPIWRLVRYERGRVVEVSRQLQ